MEEINLGMIAAMKQQAGIHSEIVSEVIDAWRMPSRQTRTWRIYTSGATIFSGIRNWQISQGK